MSDPLLPAQPADDPLTPGLAGDISAGLDDGWSRVLPDVSEHLGLLDPGGADLLDGPLHDDDYNGFEDPHHQ